MLLCGLLIAPWGVVLLVILGKPLIGAKAPWADSLASSISSGSASEDDANSLARVTIGKPGRWGQLEYTRVAIELPEEFVFVPPRDSKPVRWFFKGFNKDQMLEFFKLSGLESSQFEALAQAKVDLALNGCWITPPEEVILKLSPEARAKVYSHLVTFPENLPHVDPFCYREQLLGERLERSSLEDSSIDLFKRLLYRRGSLLLFADMETALRQLKDEAEQRRFVKTITRKTTLMAQLLVTPESDVDELVNYWSVGGRSKDLRPLLDSLSRVEGGCTLGVIHLLPRFMRQRIFTYPYTSEESEGVKHDCFWTAFNAFNDEPDDRFANLEYAGKVLQQQYYSILKPSQLGDMVFLATETGSAVHAATYIADDIVFTKNGATYTQPWILMRIDDMLAMYSIPYPAEHPLKVLYYRRKSL